MALGMKTGKSEGGIVACSSQMQKIFLGSLFGLLWNIYDTDYWSSFGGVRRQEPKHLESRSAWEDPERPVISE